MPSPHTHGMLPRRHHQSPCERHLPLKDILVNLLWVSCFIWKTTTPHQSSNQSPLSRITRPCPSQIYCFQRLIAPGGRCSVSGRSFLISARRPALGQSQARRPPAVETREVALIRTCEDIISLVLRLRLRPRVGCPVSDLRMLCESISIDAASSHRRLFATSFWENATSLSWHHGVMVAPIPHRCRRHPAIR